LEVAVTESDSSSMTAAKDLYDATNGFSAEWMSQEQMLASDSRLSSSISKGLLMEGNRMVDSPSYARAVMGAAKKLGAEFQQVEATGLKKANSNVTHVCTASGDIECDAVVFATGAWFKEISNWLEVSIPIRPLKGQMLRAKLSGARLPFHVTRGLVGIYQVLNGTVWLGGTLEDVGFDRGGTKEGKDIILNRAAEILPAIKEAEILEHLIGFRPASIDRLPIIGSSSTYTNAYIASGGGPKGMLLSTGIAEAVSNSILEIEHDFTISQFLPSRFNK